MDTRLSYTLDSLKCVENSDGRVYMLNYRNPYHLDKMLEGPGTKNTFELLYKASKNIGVPLIMIPGRFACSTFNAKTPDGKLLLARNFDYKDAPVTVVWCSPENGYKSIGFCDNTMMTYGFKRTPQDRKKRYMELLAPYTVMDGMNETGLVIAVLEQKGKATHQSTNLPDITTTLAIRTALDTCATVDEVIALFKGYDMHDAIYANYHFHVTDKSGASVIIEYVSNRMQLVYPEENKFYQYSTNFLQSNPLGDVKGNFGYNRYYVIRDRLEPKKGIVTEDEAMDILHGVTLEYRHHLLKHRVTSLWSAVYNIDDLTIDLCAGADYSKKYKFSLQEPGKNL